MAKVPYPRPASGQRTRSRTSVSEHSESEARSASDASFTPPAEPHHVWHCDIKGCSKFFMREADLRRHQRTSKQHNSKAYYCGCGRSFTRQDATRRHCLSFGHEIPASVLRGIPDDGPPPLNSQQAAQAAPATEDQSQADGIALLMAAAASLSSLTPNVSATPESISDYHSSDAEGEPDPDEEDAGDFTSSSASSSQFLTIPKGVDRTPMPDKLVLDNHRKRKFTLDDDEVASSLDLASSWSSDSFILGTPPSYISSSPDETGSPSAARRPHADSMPGLRRSNTLDLNDNILTLAAAVSIQDTNDRPLHRTKRSRSLLDTSIDYPTHASRLESRSESQAFIMSSPLRAQYA
ncbi:hypothetical protein BKA62DRAFT_685089 [Auriculariales sp. MPI-PUGE-AT-0066]|nr:hypothetical protein BKA62DRAFT_685089 [Auriculariales sp. MPI-PUGE-AT-0066]